MSETSLARLLLRRLGMPEHEIEQTKEAWVYLKTEGRKRPLRLVANLVRSYLEPDK